MDKPHRLPAMSWFRRTGRLCQRIPFFPAIALVICLFLSGCLTATPTLTPGPITTPTDTPSPTATATPQPLGHPTNPLYIGVLSFDQNASVEIAAQSLAETLSQETGLTVQAKGYSSYQSLLNGMADRQVHIAWLPPLTYLYASRLGIAKAALLTSHFGVYQYGTQFLANSSSGFTPYFDPISGLNSADAATALAQFANLRPCWVDPTSATGYLVPAGLLALNDIPTGEPAFTQTHAAVVRSLYVKGVCDFGATFSISGDPRTASAVLADLPDAIERIPIIWRSDAVIPNVNVSYITGLPEAVEKQLDAAFLKIAQTEQGRQMLAASAGDYQIDALKSIDDSLYDPLRLLINALGSNLQDLIGR